jgi:hypothetical protein
MISAQARSDSPSLRPASDRQDRLPAFSALTNDDDRERKAELQRPGTFSVVVTPGSFADLPEYAAVTYTTLSRRTSGRSVKSTITSPDAGSMDPNIVILEKFQEALTSPLAGPYAVILPVDKRTSLPDTLQNMTLAPAQFFPLTQSVSEPASPQTRMTAAEVRLVLHFRHYIVQRLVPPVYDGLITNSSSPGSTRDIFEIESARFKPLHHAICAISALHLSCHDQATLEEAIEHYAKALSAEKSASNADELLSDGVFFRHYLLFVYDICMNSKTDGAGEGMWAQHLDSLRHLAQQRFHRNGMETHPYLIWSICVLDVNASLMGHDNCGFIRAMMDANMLPPVGQGLPTSGFGSPDPCSSSEAHLLPAIFALNRGVIFHAAKLAKLAQDIRNEVSTGTMPASPGRYARWSAAVSQTQGQLFAFWTEGCPVFLENNPLSAARQLTPRTRAIFEHVSLVSVIFRHRVLIWDTTPQATMLFQAIILYSRTSIFPGQRLIPVANQINITNDSNNRATHILNTASSLLAAGELERRDAVFPIFMAGVASALGDSKLQAIDQLKAFERHGIGQNTMVVRKLLVGVCQEQSRRVSVGGRAEEVDWLTYGKELGLSVVNCGL